VSDHPTGSADAAPHHDRFQASVRITLFGHDPTTGEAEVKARSRRWRTLRALQVVAVGLVAAPVVALVPPHAPWAIGALVGAAILARRRFAEDYTLVAIEATCPRCQAPLVLSSSTRLRRPHPVSCESCHHQPTLRVDVE